MTKQHVKKVQEIEIKGSSNTAFIWQQEGIRQSTLLEEIIHFWFTSLPTSDKNFRLFIRFHQVKGGKTHDKPPWRIQVNLVDISHNALMMC